MSSGVARQAGPEAGLSAQVAAALPMPVLIAAGDLEILFANPAAEQFFAMGAPALTRCRLGDLVPVGSPLLQAIAQALGRQASVAERDVDLSTPRHGVHAADILVTPLPGHEGSVLIVLHD